MTDPICKATAVGVVTKGADDESSDSGTFEVILSTPTRDRDGEEVKSEEWVQPLPDHITFDIDHGMSVATTVGSGVPSINDDGQLVVRGSWASTDLAQTTRTLVNEGHIKTTSVAFMRRKSTKGNGGVERELLNGAFVAVPANPEALVLVSKSLESAAEPSVVAQLVAKAIAGSYEERERAVYDALSAKYDSDDTWAYPVATFDDQVVYRVSGGENAGTSWRAEYSINDDGTATLGEPEKVVISEVVTTVSEGSDTASDDAESAAEKAADSASEDAEERTLEVERKNALDNLRAALALGS